MGLNPKYPVYIISKSRWDTRLTSKSLEEINVPYHIVVEPQEYDQYASVICPDKILVLPFSNLRQGSIPARNWVWEHSKQQGAKRHWIMDDNINGFYRMNKNEKIKVGDGTIFRCAEDFIDRYANIPMAGLQYVFMMPRRYPYPPIYKNTRIYSCILLANDLNEKWRGRYNEDTDLSLRILKKGYCTILFNIFSCGKAATMTMSGGNTESLYRLDNADGRLLMAQSLQSQHPDVTTVRWKRGRWQHHVDYSRFRNNKLTYVKGFVPPKGINNYGMILYTGR